MYTFFNSEDYIKEDTKIASMLSKAKGVYTDEIKNTQLDDRGISIDDKKGKVGLNASKFIQYCMTRVEARQNPEGIWFYNHSAKRYDMLSLDEYKKVFFNIYEEASTNTWKKHMENEYIAYFQNKVKQFEIDGNRPGFLQFDNCILDFSGEEVGPIEPSPENFCNFRIPYSFDYDAECPKFMEFLNDIFDGDQERIDLIQEIMGACIYYDKFMQYLVVFLGNGSNGKSLLANMIQHMLGDNNVSAIALDKLSGDRFSKQNLDRKLLNISSETKPEKVYSTADIKALTGGDMVEVEKKFRDSYTTAIHCKYILLANDMIQTEDYSDGFYRRLIIIPFDQHYYDYTPGEEKDENKRYKDVYLEEELKNELPGIFNFALDGFIRLNNNQFNFTSSSACEKAKNKYKREQNIVKLFVDECVDIVGIKSKKKVKSSELFPRFQSFCRQNHYSKQLNSTTKNQFFKLLKNMIETEGLDIAYKKNNDNNYYVGIQFK